MVGKNNREVLLKREANNIKRYAIKRTSVGVVSAVVAAGLLFGQDISVQADEITGTESQVSEVSSEASVETESVEETEVLESSQADAEQDEEITEESIEATEAYEEETSIEETEYDQTTLPTEETSIESYDEVEESAVEVQEVETDEEEIVETTETAVSSEVISEGEEAQEDTEVVEESTSTTEEVADAQPQMRTLAAAASNVSNEDTQLPELISISTDKEVYQAGEEIKISAIVKENVALDRVYVYFNRIGTSETGPDTLSAGAYGIESGLSLQEDGTYKAEMSIALDENIPSNSYELDRVALYDQAENSVWLYANRDLNGLLDVNFDITNDNEDIIMPELLDIYTNKDVYQAGEEIKISAIVKENVALDRVYVYFNRVGTSETGPDTLSTGAYGMESGLSLQEDGTYKAEMSIALDENIPSNSYELDRVALYDQAENSVWLYANRDSNGLLDVNFDITNDNEDIIMPELLDIYTDKDIYQAGEEIKISAIVKENVALDRVYVYFNRVGTSEVGPDTLSTGAYGMESGLSLQEDGTYKAEMSIALDENIPSNSYELDRVALYDQAENSVWLYANDNLNEDLNILFSINVNNIPYATVRELNINLTPGSREILIQKGVNGSADATTGEIINEPISEIIQYAPVEIPFETVKIISSELYIGENNVISGQVGLLDPETNEVVIAPINEIVEVGSKVYVAPEEIAYEVNRVLDTTLVPGSSDVVVQEGQVGLRDGETGEVLSNPVTMIVHYAPAEVEYDVERSINLDKTPNTGDTVIQSGSIGLMDPETGEIVVEPTTEIIEFAPITIGYQTSYEVSESLEPNSGDQIDIQVGVEGLQNPETGEVLSQPVDQIIGVAPTEVIDDNTIQNIITVIDQATNQEIASTTFLGNNYSLRQNYFISQLNEQHDLDLEVASEEVTSHVRNSSSVNGYTVSSTTIKKNIYVVNHSSTDISDIERPFLPEGVIYNNQDNDRAYRRVVVKDDSGSTLYRTNFVSNESTDDTIRNVMSNIDSNNYYYDSVDVSGGYITTFGTSGYYAGPLREITILVNRIETPVEPEVPTEEEETPVEPEVPTEEEETPAEPEVPTEEEETPAEPEVPTEEEETPVEPEVPSEEEETPVEPEVPSEEVETPVDPEEPTEEEETPAEPEVPTEEEEMPVEPEVPTEEEETPAEPEVPSEEEETPVEPEVPSEEVETPVDPEKPTEEEETSVESEVPTEEETPSNSNQTSEVVAEEIVDSSVVNTEQLTAKETEGNVVATNIATKDSEDKLVIDNQAATKVSESSEEEVAELPETGAQSMNALVTGLGMLTTAVGAFFIRKKK